MVFETFNGVGAANSGLWAVKSVLGLQILELGCKIGVGAAISIDLGDKIKILLETITLDEKRPFLGP